MEKVRLGDVCDILNGYAFKSDKYVSDGIRIIRIANVQKGYIEDSTPVFYPDNDVLAKKYLLCENDLLISLTGNVGRVARLNKELLPAALNQRVACLRKKNSNYDMNFLFNFLNSDYFEEDCISNSKGVAQKNMSTEWLKDYEIPYFTLDEQHRIAFILDKLTDLINKRKQQLQKLDELVKARFVEMFGDPEINQNHWEVDTLGNYMTTLTDFSANGSYELLDSNVVMYDEPNYAIMVRTVDLEKGELAENVKYIDRNAYDLLSKSQLYGGELIMNKIGSAGKIYIMPYINKPASLGRNAFMFRFDERINMTYLYHLLSSEYGTKEIQQYVRGAVTKTITKDSTRAIKILVPPIELQNKFATFVDEVGISKSALQKSVDKLELLKKALMQEYFG